MPVPNQSLTPYELVELHELLSMEVMEMKKLRSSSTTLPEGSQLASYIDDVVKTKEQHIGELKQFISSGVLQ
ncbi:hypothetical protein [Desulfosporosinus sp. OT]|uniref:hypothetical protein n=1 Tax=Desulfosporosinus sp. OT TaxID=913865 RepID=UPI000223AD81|nr:hypothetical protein [Desulfosporosinus sp. OT]EGW39683.1 hypothetical protein DOT_2419 [Desulfosporosinus sp. OT]